IAPSFADIFYNNCFKNGILPIRLPETEVETLFQNVQDSPGYQLTVDLEQQTIYDSQGFQTTFAIDEYRRTCLLNGLDDIGVTLQSEEKIAEHEAKLPAYFSIPSEKLSSETRR